MFKVFINSLIYTWLFAEHGKHCVYELTGKLLRTSRTQEKTTGTFKIGVVIIWKYYIFHEVEAFKQTGPQRQKLQELLFTGRKKSQMIYVSSSLQRNRFINHNFSTKDIPVVFDYGRQKCQIDIE